MKNISATMSGIEGHSSSRENGFATTLTCGFVRKAHLKPSSIELCLMLHRRLSVPARSDSRMKNCWSSFVSSFRSMDIFQASSSMKWNGPSSSVYQHRFGSLLRAYELVGFTPDRDYRYIEINRALRQIHPHVVEDTIAGIEKAGGEVKQDPSTDLLTINEEFTASIVIVRCRETEAGSLRWHIRLDTGL